MAVISVVAADAVESSTEREPCFSVQRSSDMCVKGGPSEGRSLYESVLGLLVTFGPPVRKVRHL